MVASRVAAGHGLEEHRELVATEARDGVLGTELAPQALCDRTQERVARGMAEARRSPS